MIFLISQCEFGDDEGLGIGRCDFRPGDIHESDQILLAFLVRGGGGVSLKIAINSCTNLPSQPYC